jgi:hypothetical protein
MITFLDPAPAITTADLADVERRFGFSFPSLLRSIYLEFNGGIPSENRYRDENGECIVHEFLSIKTGPPELTLESTLRRVTIDQKILPKSLIPFAVDPGGNFYCFDTGWRKPKSIVLYRTGFSENDDQAVDYLCDSMEDFIARLGKKR